MIRYKKFVSAGVQFSRHNVCILPIFIMVLRYGLWPQPSKEDWHIGQLVSQIYHPYSLDRFWLQWHGSALYGTTANLRYYPLILPLSCWHQCGNYSRRQLHLFDTHRREGECVQWFMLWLSTISSVTENSPSTGMNRDSTLRSSNISVAGLWQFFEINFSVTQNDSIISYV